MKRKILILFIAFTSTVVSAQSLIPVKYGISTGFSLSSFNITSAEGIQPTDNSSQIGISAGLIIHIPLSDKWFINPEVLYSQKGSSFNYSFTHDYDVNQRDIYKTTNQLTLSYLDINPIISYKASDKFALNLGPSVSFLIGEKYVYTQDPAKENLNSPNLLTDGVVKVESLDIGLNIGVSYFLTEHFLINAKINNGLMQVATADQPTELVNNSDTETEYTFKNSSINLSITYLF